MRGMTLKEVVNLAVAQFKRDGTMAGHITVTDVRVGGSIQLGMKVTVILSEGEPLFLEIDPPMHGRA